MSTNNKSWNAVGPNLDDGDDWYLAEESKMAKLYGEGFLRVYCTEQGIIVYLCEICNAEMNGKPSLKSHCEGMKHLKKKNQFENGTLKVPGGQLVPKYLFGNPRGHPYPKAGPSQYQQNQPWQRGAPSHSSRDARSNTRRYEPYHQEGRYGATQQPRYDQGMPPHQPSYGQPMAPTLQPTNPVIPKLAGSATGAILMKLGGCCVKNVDDADLAMNVMEVLTRSLKEYGVKTGEMKATELLIDAELKVSTIRALQAGAFNN